ncbi:MAG: hypothetical protein ACLQK4_02335 [Acidimicrobiales bacterium]|jgi:hypothetical protein
MRARLLAAGIATAVMTLTTLGVSLVPASASAHSSAPPAHAMAPQAAGTVKCPAGTPTNSTCATIPAHCPTGGDCPEIIAEPTSGLAETQAVYLTMENFFNSSDSIYVQYCQDTKPLSVKPPLCVKTAVAQLTEPQVILKPYPDTGSVSYAYQVLYLAKGSTPFSGVVPGQKKFGTFLCDSADPCSIDVTDPFLGPHGSASALTPNPQNTAVIPVSFAAGQAGCPRAMFITTESEFGIDSLLGAAAAATCSGARPVGATNIDLDAPAAVNAFVQGGMPISLTDSPLAPDEQAALQTIKGQYALVPVALSANVIGFQAIAQGQQGYPDTSFKLTPNMAAGLITNFYSTSYDSDVAKCSWRSTHTCPLIEMTNPVPGFEAPVQYGSYVRGDSSTPTYAFFQWVCNAPAVPLEIDHHEVSEPYTVEKLLNYAWTLNGLKALKSCPSTLDTFPGLQKDVPNFGTASDPEVEVSKLQGFVPLPQDSTEDPRAGFTDISWPDAHQYGLSVAALQNGAGKFVLPSTESLEAAASAMHPDAAGIYTYDYANKNPDAYPMPDVWYALVSTKPQPSQTAAQDKTLIDDLLDVSGGSKAGSLPTGYAPLPKEMYKAALADVTKDITTAVQTPPPTTTPLTTTPVTTPATTPSTLLPSGTTTPATTPPTTVPSKPSGHQHAPQGSTKLPTQLASFVLTSRSDTWMTAVFACLLAAGVVFGPGLWLWARRRKAGSHGST